MQPRLATKALSDLAAQRQGKARFACQCSQSTVRKAFADLQPWLRCVTCGVIRDTGSGAGFVYYA